MSTKIALVGMCRDVYDLLDSEPSVDLCGVIDPDESLSDRFGIDRDWPEIKRQYPGIRAVIGVSDTRLRRILCDLYNVHLTSFWSADAYVSSRAAIGDCCLIQRGCTVLAARVQNHCKLDVGATVHHDCVVSDYCTLGPGSRLCGRVVLGEQCYIGAGAIVLPGVTLGPGVTVGAGSVVTKDFQEGVIVGTPAKEIRK